MFSPPFALFTSAPADLLVIAVLILLFLAPKRLPGMGKSIGSGLREFKDSLGSSSKEFKEGLNSGAAPDEDPEKTATKTDAGTEPGSTG